MTSDDRWSVITGGDCDNHAGPCWRIHRAVETPGQPRKSPHGWIGSPIGDGDGQWYCPRCQSVCDHENPCGRHGTCIPSLWERLRSGLPWWPVAHTEKGERR